MPIFTTACPRNCYSTCSMRVLVEDGKIKAIESHPDNKATPEGVCLKVLSYIERVYSPDRILEPLKKNHTTNNFEPITWNEALDIIVDNLNRLKKNYGTQGILFYKGSGTKGLLNEVSMNFWKLFGGCTTTYGDLCWPAGLEATRLTLGENKHNAPWDIVNSKLIILWGKNSAETNIHQSPFILQALENGGKLIVIDPRRTQSAERAELLIQPRPGTDGALALGIAHLLIKNDLIDNHFITKHLLGYEKFKELALDYDPGKVSEITDIPVEYIHRISKYIGTIKPVTINAGFGLQRYTNGGQTMRAIISLLALTGNISKPGAGWIYANLQSHIFDKVKDPIASYPPDKSDENIRISVSTIRLGQDMLRANYPLIKMAWIERGNPITQNPETHTILKAFRALDFRVVVEQFLTDTAREADIILPAKTMFEQSDVIGAYWHPYIQLKQKMIEPPGKVKPETEIYYLLAQRLGFSEEDLVNKIPEPNDDAIEYFLNKKLELFPELTLTRLKDGPVIAPGTQEIAFSDFVFSTPSGKIELSSEEAKERWGLNSLPDYKEPDESIKNNSVDGRKYPLYLMTPNTKNRIHSQFNNLKLINQFSEKPIAIINPEDALIRGIQNNDVIKVFNDRGKIELKAQIDLGIKKGCISVSNGWWITEGGTVNYLSSGRETDMGYGAAFHENLVEIEKIM